MIIVMHYELLYFYKERNNLQKEGKLSYKKYTDWRPVEKGGCLCILQKSGKNSKEIRKIIC
jgi:hypothetical protein